MPLRSRSNISDRNKNRPAWRNFTPSEVLLRLVVLVLLLEGEEDVVVAAMAAPRAISRISHAKRGQEIVVVVLLVEELVADDLEFEIPTVVPAKSTGPFAATHRMAPPGR